MPPPPAPAPTRPPPAKCCAPRFIPSTSPPRPNFGSCIELSRCIRSTPYFRTAATLTTNSFGVSQRFAQIRERRHNMRRGDHHIALGNPGGGLLLIALPMGNAISFTGHLV